jgi:hypothetical protein
MEEVLDKSVVVCDDLEDNRVSWVG